VGRINLYRFMSTSLDLRRIGVVAFAITIVAVALFVLAIGEGLNAQSNSTCTDSDEGKDYYTEGRVNIVTKIGETVDSGVYFDVCSNNILKEMYCASATDSRVSSENYTCPNGCKDGACVEAPAEEPPAEECVDSDNGRDYFVKGETTDGATREDVCRDAKTLVEFYCEQARGQKRPTRGAEEKKCEYGCEDGACKEAPSEDELARIEKLKGIIVNIGGVNGMIKGMAVIEGAFRQIAKDGVVMPEDLKQTVAKVKEVRPEIMKFRNKKAENLTSEQAEALTGYASEMCGAGATLEEWGGRLPQYLLLSAKMKRVSKDLKQAKIDAGRTVKIALSSKYGLSDKAEELNEAVEALQTISNDFIATDDLDEKDRKMNEFYNQFQSIYNMIWTINALQNAGQAVDTSQFKNFKIFGDFCGS